VPARPAILARRLDRHGFEKRFAFALREPPVQGGGVLTSRVVKLVMVGSLALFAFLVTFGNVTDYGANFQFVRHVLSMDTIFPDNPLAYRAITNPFLWHLGYAVIILGEGLTCAAFTLAAMELARSLRSDAAQFRRSKRFVFVGAGLGFLVWFFGFMVVGGEWFAMWQSNFWNGQQAAFRFYVTLLGVLIFVNQDDPELEPR
jgi:predicted small integral membrane protein